MTDGRGEEQCGVNLSREQCPTVSARALGLGGASGSGAAARGGGEIGTLPRG